MRDAIKSFIDEFDIKSAQKGKELYQKDAVYKIYNEGKTYHCLVKGISDTYKTIIKFDKKGDINSCYCSCPHFDRGYLCKHLYASLLALDDYLDSEKDSEIDNEQSNIIEADFKESENEDVLENQSNLEQSNLKLTKNAIASFKQFATDYSVDTDSMLSFLNSYNLTSSDLVTLFTMIKKAKPLEVFLTYLEKNINIDFFKNIDLSLFPSSYSLKPLAQFFINHPELLQYLSLNSLSQLFLKNKISSIDERITLLFLCLNYNAKGAIKAFFDEKENKLDFFKMFL